MENERDFKGVWIPKAVWLDDRLNALDKVILTEIDSLDMGDRGCYASNAHLAKFCQCSETKVSTAISKLISYGYLYVQKFDGRTRELKSSLSKFERQDFKNCKADLQDLKENNTDRNTKNNTDKRDIAGQSPTAHSFELKIIIDYLNEKAGTHYRTTTGKTKSLVSARMKEGFSIDDFKAVIDKKCSEWLGTDMAQYLRPETLFGTKFEGYLNQKGARGKREDEARKWCQEPPDNVDIEKYREEQRKRDYAIFYGEG